MTEESEHISILDFRCVLKMIIHFHQNCNTGCDSHISAYQKVFRGSFMVQLTGFTYDFHRTAGTPTTFTKLQVHLRLSQNCRYTYDFHRTAGTPTTFTEL